MKTKLVYASKTNHSKRIAEKIGEELQIPVESVKNHPGMEDVDLLLIVGGIYGSKCHPDILEFASKLEENQVKKAALVTSCLSKISKQDEVRRLLQEKHVEVIDEFLCKGNFLFFGVGHPTEKEISSAAEFAKNIVDQM